MLYRPEFATTSAYHSSAVSLLVLIGLRSSAVISSNGATRSTTAEAYLPAGE